jgi:hypothetical protein
MTSHFEDEAKDDGTAFESIQAILYERFMSTAGALLVDR